MHQSQNAQIPNQALQKRIKLLSDQHCKEHAMLSMILPACNGTEFGKHPITAGMLKGIFRNCPALPRYIRLVNRNFLGRGVFLELGHLDKHSTTTQEKKAPHGKNHGFFCLESLKNCILNEKSYPQMITIMALFPQIRVLFLIFGKRQGRSPPLVTHQIYGDLLPKPCFKFTKILTILGQYHTEMANT